MKRKSFLSSLTCEQVAGQTGKMSMLILSDKDHMNIFGSFLKHKVGFLTPWCGLPMWRVHEEDEGAQRGVHEGTLLIFLLFYYASAFVQKISPHCWIPLVALDATGCCGVTAQCGQAKSSATSWVKDGDRLQTPSDNFDYFHYFGDSGVTPSAKGTVLPGFECVGLESELNTFATSCVQRQFSLHSPVVSQEAYKDEIKPSLSYWCG